MKSLRNASIVMLATLTGITMFSDPAFGKTSSCQVISHGEAGSRGDFVRISAREPYESPGVKIIQTGNRLEFRLVNPFSENSGFNGTLPRGTALDCGEAPITTSSIDRIDLDFSRARFDSHALSLDMSRARPGHILAPGATPEAAGSEIEIRITDGPEGIRPDGLISFSGTPGRDRIEVGSFRGLVTMNFNPGKDGQHPDQDILPGLPVDGVGLWGRNGADSFSAAPRDFEPLPSWVNFKTAGENGDDELTGHSGRDIFSGDSGNDILASFAGRDHLVGGPGEDRILAGPGDDSIGDADEFYETGSDVIRAGPGADRVFKQNDGFRDDIDCASGRDRIYDFDLGVDRLHSCERP